MAAIRMNDAGKLTVANERAMVTLASSSGWRNASSDERVNAGNSSRKRTPKWAKDTSPALGIVPPPTRAGVLAEWWGMRTGRVAINATPGGNSPEME